MNVIELAILGLVIAGCILAAGRKGGGGGASPLLRK